MTFMQQLNAYTNARWQERVSLLPEDLRAEAEALLADSGEGERNYLAYVLATLPLSDLAEYELSLFQKTVHLALEAREEFPWCRELAEPLFLLHVLYPRINNEELEDYRELFREALKERVRGLSTEQAILEVNRWCAEQATYRSTDDRTASALQVYTCGYGRCGEESVFAVNALRSVGLCARQVYAPRWSHCDDNHAWVEVYDGKRWRYLGACEPEPELDRGWFTDAASRAMMIHARYFLPEEPREASFLFPGVDPATLWTEQGVLYENLTARYGSVKELTVTVTEKDGMPVSGAQVCASVVNFAGPEQIAVQKSGQTGQASFLLGKGSVLLSVFSDGKQALAWCDTEKTDSLTLVLEENREEEFLCEEVDFLAPMGKKEYALPLSREQKELRQKWLQTAEHCRAERNAGQNRYFVLPESELGLTLTEKDLAGGIPEGVLEDTAGQELWKEQFPGEIWRNYIFCPRIGTEPLAPWKKALSNAFSEEKQEAFRQNPRKLWQWLETEFRVIPSFEDIPASPAAGFRLMAGTAASRNILFCGLYRAQGIPARLSPRDHQPEYWQEGAFHSVREEEDSAHLVLTAPDGQDALCRKNCSLSCLENGKFVSLNFGNIPGGESRELSLKPGRYLLLTACRLPSGNQLLRRWEFSLAPGEEREISLSFRRGKPEEMLQEQLLPPFSLWNSAGQEIPAQTLLSKAPASLLLWLEPGREPTEHILNELRETAAAFSGGKCRILFVLEDFRQAGDHTLQKTLSALPEAELFQGDFFDTVPLLARRMFADPEKLPLLLLTDSRGRGLFSAAGYHVGTAELLVRLLSVLQEAGNL